MGNSAQDHRVMIGMFAGRMSSSSGSSCTGSYKLSGRRPDPDPEVTWPKNGMLTTVRLMVLVTILIFLVINTLTEVVNDRVNYYQECNSVTSSTVKIPNFQVKIAKEFKIWLAYCSFLQEMLNATRVLSQHSH